MSSEQPFKQSTRSRCAQPFGSAAPVSSKGIPLLVGSTLSEFNNFPNPALRGHEHWNEADFHSYLQAHYGQRADAVLAAYKKAYPALGPSLWPTVDTAFRAGVLHTAQLKAAQGDPVFTYIFAWRSPVLQHWKKLNVVRRWLTIVAVLCGVERRSAPAVLSHHSW